MKNNLQLNIPYKPWAFPSFALLGLLILIAFPAEGQITIWTESFETNGNTVNGGESRYSSPNDFHDGVTDDDYWGRVRGIDQVYFLTNASSGIVASSNQPYVGYSGNFYYAGEDMDDTGGSIGAPDGNSTKQILFPSINIAGATSMVFKGLFARGETDPCGSSTYDQGDYIEVYYTIDAGTEVLALCFNPDLECGGTVGDFFNEPLYMDPNCDGDGGEGTILTNALQEFSFSLAGTGSVLEIRLEVSMNLSSEEVAVDFFRVESATPLPVTLTQLEAKNKDEQVLLHWVTSSEINNEGFDIQRSGDGHDWEKIGFTQGHGNTSSTNNYQFLDVRPLPGMNYYRLLQLDFDGSEDLSEVVSVNRIKDQLDLTISPNPFSDRINLNLSQSLDGDIQAEVFDHLGRKVDAFLLEKDQQDQTFDFSNLEAGIFFIRLQYGNQVITKRVVKF